MQALVRDPDSPRLVSTVRPLLIASLGLAVGCSSPTAPADPIDAALVPDRSPIVDQGVVDRLAVDGAPLSVPPAVISRAAWSAAESDPYLSVAAQGTIAGAWIASTTDGAATLGYALSRDGGRSWTAPRRLDSPDGRDASDPALTPDGDGGFFLTWTPVNLTSYEADAVYVAHLPAGGESFGSFVEVSDPALHLSYDQPKIHRTAAGTLLVTYNRRADDQASTPNQIGVSRSTDQGSSWTRGVLADGNGYRNQAFFCGQSSSGRLLVLYSSWEEGLVVRGSDDDGASWPVATRSVVVPASDVHSVEFEPVCAMRGDGLWVVYSTGAPGATFAKWKSAAIKVAHSPDGGATFDPPVDALDPAGPPYSKHATLAIDAASGALAITYYGGSSDSDGAGTLRLVRSLDGGRHFGASQSLGGASFTSSREWPLWMGDYMGLVRSGSSLAAVYVDGSSGAAHVAATVVPAGCPSATCP